MAPMGAESVPHRGAPIPMLVDTGYPLVNDLRDAGYIIDQKRLQRVHADPASGTTMVGQTQNLDIQADRISGFSRYAVTIMLTNGRASSCECFCPDWLKGGVDDRVPCKHILAVCVDAQTELDARNMVFSTTAPRSAPQQGAAFAAIRAQAAQIAQEAEVPDAEIPAKVAARPLPSRPLTFNEKVRAEIAKAVMRMADMIEPYLAANRVPFLLGPTDVAKTSALRLVAVRNGWGLEQLDGMSSYADADLVGFKTDHGTYPSVIARAFERARNGEKVLLFLDELTRFNTRAMDVLMRPLLPVSPDVAAAQRVNAGPGEFVRLVEVPMWGLDWAPLENCKLALAANPWGAPLDPALVRRTVPLEINFDAAVAEMFQRPTRDAIETSWKLVREGKLSLPIGYTLIGEARSPTDVSWAPTYFGQLRAIDRPAADGFKTLLDGMGIKLGV